MKTELKQVVLAGSVCTVAALFVACGGGGGGSSDGGSGGGGLGVYSGKTTSATITEPSVKETLKGMNDLFPSCTATGVGKVAVEDQLKTVLPVVKIAQSMVIKASAKTTGKSVALIPTSAPTTTPGNCPGAPGSISYPTYSHLSGTTTVAVKLDNYCTVDSTTGNKTTMNGTINAVDAGTPGASGPVTNKVTANIPKITVVEKTSAGATVSSTTIAMSGLVYTPTSGASANPSDPLASSLPGTTKVTALEVKAIEGTKETQIKLTNLNAVTGKSGLDSTLAISGTVCRATSGCSNFTTATTPFVVDSNQNFKSGQITFTGANNSNTTLTAVPGSTGQTLSVKVNGTTVQGAQLACDGL